MTWVTYQEWAEAVDDLAADDPLGMLREGLAEYVTAHRLDAMAFAEPEAAHAYAADLLTPEQIARCEALARTRPGGFRYVPDRLAKERLIALRLVLNQMAPASLTGDATEARPRTRTAPRDRKSWTIPCDVCGEHFAARRPDARFCSPRCRQKASRGRRIGAPDAESLGAGTTGAGLSVTAPAAITLASAARHNGPLAESADSVTVLRSVDGATLTKTVTRLGDGSFEVVAYDRGFKFAVREEPVAGIAELGRLLATLEGDPHACVIRGAPLPETNRRRCRRLLYPVVEEDGSLTLPTFEPSARRWVALDFDALPVPIWNPGDLAARRAAIERDRLANLPMPPKGPSDGEDYDFEADGDPAPIDPARDWALVVRAAVSTLPAEFAGAHAFWQMTSQAGIKDGARLRLWYWCDREVSDAECKRWLEASPVDRSLFSPVQPHFTAAPVFRPRSADPVPRRSGMWWRHFAEVPVPELPELPEPAPPLEPVLAQPIKRQEAVVKDHRELARQCLARSGLTVWERDFCTKAASLATVTPKQAETLATIADPMPAKARAYAAAALRGVETASTGERHPTLMAVAVRLYSLADKGLLDHADVTARLLDAAKKPLSATERAQRCERRGDRPSGNEQAVDWARARAKAAPDLPEWCPR